MIDRASSTEKPEPVAGRGGIHPARERLWGLVGALVGSIGGGGLALVAVTLDGVPMWGAGPLPAVFHEARLLALDLGLAAGVVLGAGFSICSLVLARTSPWPRSDAYGAGLVGALLSALAGSILFARLLALIR